MSRNGRTRPGFRLVAGGDRHAEESEGHQWAYVWSPYHRVMDEKTQSRVADLLRDVQGALVEMENRLPRANEDVAGARQSWERATRAVSNALALVEPED
jgi:hypothetical protein